MQVQVGHSNAAVYHVGGDAYTVEVGIGGGNCAYHVGPAPYPYFTLEQAERLAAKVNHAGTITLEYWTDGYCMPLKAEDVAARPVLEFA